MTDRKQFDEEFRELAKRHGIKAAWIEFRETGETELGVKMETNVGGWMPSTTILANVLKHASVAGSFKMKNRADS